MIRYCDSQQPKCVCLTVFNLKIDTRQQKKKNLRKKIYYYYLKDECLLDFAKNCHGCYDIYKEQTCQFLAKSMKNLYH